MVLGNCTGLQLQDFRKIVTWGNLTQIVCAVLSYFILEIIWQEFYYIQNVQQVFFWPISVPLLTYAYLHASLEKL